MKQGVVSSTSTGIFQEYSTEILFKFPETGKGAGIFRLKLRGVSRNGQPSWNLPSETSTCFMLSAKTAKLFLETTDAEAWKIPGEDSRYLKFEFKKKAPQHALRRSKLAVLRRDDKMLQSRLLDTLKLQESQIVAETAAVKRLSASLQRLRGRTQEELQQRATTAQLNDATFDLKRLAAMQKAEYKSLMLTKAQPGPPGLPGPRGLPGRNGINGSPGSIQELVPVSRNRLSAVPPGHWADEGLFRRSHPASARARLSFLPPSLPPAIPPPYQPFPNKIETLPNGVKCVLPQSLAFLSVEYLLELIPSFCRYQTHWVSKDEQRSWDNHPPIPPPHRSVPPLLHAAEHERSRALSNAQFVLPATLFRGNQQLAGTDMFKPSDSSADMHRTGLQHRFADVQRNQDNSGFFESPASVIEE